MIFSVRLSCFRNYYIATSKVSKFITINLLEINLRCHWWTTFLICVFVWEGCMWNFHQKPSSIASQSLVWVHHVFHLVFNQRRHFVRIIAKTCWTFYVHEIWNIIFFLPLLLRLLLLLLDSIFSFKSPHKCQQWVHFCCSSANSSFILLVHGKKRPFQST